MALTTLVGGLYSEFALRKFGVGGPSGEVQEDGSEEGARRRGEETQPMPGLPVIVPDKTGVNQSLGVVDEVSPTRRPAHACGTGEKPAHELSHRTCLGRSYIKPSSSASSSSS